MTAEEEIAKFWSLSSPVGQTTNAAKEQPPAKSPQKEGKGHKERCWEEKSTADGRCADGRGPGPAHPLDGEASLEARGGGTAAEDGPLIHDLFGHVRHEYPQPVADSSTRVESSQRGRTLLFGKTISELLARLQKIEQDATALEKAVTAGWVLKDPLRWTFQVWNADKKANETDASKGTAAQAEIIQGLQLLKQASAQDPFVHRFHTVKPMADKYATDTVLMLLTVTMKGQNSIKAHEVLTSLTNSSALRLIGMRLRPEHQQRSHLGQQLAQLL